jgi:hypothetical protein
MPYPPFPSLHVVVLIRLVVSSSIELVVKFRISFSF